MCDGLVGAIRDSDVQSIMGANRQIHDKCGFPVPRIITPGPTKTTPVTFPALWYLINY